MPAIIAAFTGAAESPVTFATPDSIRVYAHRASCRRAENEYIPEPPVGDRGA
jgi:hypothetical protein